MERDEIQARLDRLEEQQTTRNDMQTVKDMPIVSEVDPEEDLDGLNISNVDLICEALTEAGIDFTVFDI